MPANVLIVEQKTPLREAIARSIEALPDVRVHRADDVAEALSLPDAHEADVVVVDLDTPEALLERLVAEIRSNVRPLPVVLLCDDRRDGAADGELPADLPGLRILLRAALSRPPPFTMDEYLQMAHIGGHSVRVTVRPPDAPGGEVLVWRGDVCAARDDRGEGRDAFLRLAAAALRSDTCVACETLAKAPASRNLPPGAWQALLLDAARLRDEGKAPPGSGAREPGAVLELLDLDEADGRGRSGDDGSPPAPPPGLDFDELVEAGVEALLSRDRPLALACFEAAEALRPGDSFVRANLERLRELLAPSP